MGTENNDDNYLDIMTTTVMVTVTVTVTVTMTMMMMMMMRTTTMMMTMMMNMTEELCRNEQRGPLDALYVCIA